MRSTKKTGCRPRCAFLGERNRCKNYNCSTQQLYCLKTGIEVETQIVRDRQRKCWYSRSHDSVSFNSLTASVASEGRRKKLSHEELDKRRGASLVRFLAPFILYIF